MIDITNEGQIEILLVEDNPGDVRLVMEAFKDSEVPLNFAIAADGQEAMNILKPETKIKKNYKPNLIILDLNLPKKNGREVLKEIKEDADLKQIPVVILTTSNAREDIRESYNNNANSYITKPVGLDDYLNVCKSIQDFWLENVKLPL